MRYVLLVCISFFYLYADAHILLYHRFNDDRYPTTSTSTKDLIDQFNYLKDNNYKVVPLDNIIEKIEKNEDIPDKWVAITIDDSYKSFYENGFKVFKEFNYPFTMFIYVEGTHNKYPDFMSWSELKEISELGTLEYHSYAHPSMVKIDKEKLSNDFKKGLTLFEDNLDKKSNYFSYPYGEMNGDSQELIASYGFRAIFNQNNGAINKISDLTSLDRLAIVGKTNLKNLLSTKYLKAVWEEPKKFPKDSLLKNIAATADTDKTKAKLYITDIGWMDVDVKNGKIEKKLDTPLSKNRVRIILKVDDKISTKIITKGE